MTGARGRVRRYGWVKRCCWLTVLLVGLWPTGTGYGQGPIKDDKDPRVKAAVKRATAFLLNEGRMPQRVGELSLIVHALAKVHERYPDLLSEDNPIYQNLVQQLRKRCTGGFYPSPNRTHGKDNYEAGCAAMALSAAGGDRFKTEIKNVADYIISKQLPCGAWDYSGRTTGDSSMTQYAILGLWEAADGAGVKVPKEVWDRAAQWLVTRQNPSDGGWGYHPPDPGSGLDLPESTHTMTVAGIGSVYICRDHLPGGRRRNTRGVIIAVRDEDEQQSNYVPKTSPAQIADSLRRGLDWLDKHFTINKARGEGDPGGGNWRYYYLYALERAGTLAGRKQFGGVDWYSQGAAYIIETQQKNGGWSTGRETLGVHTSFCILFLIRSTHVSKIRHLRRLGRGTLVSGKGLPSDLSKLDLVGGQLRAKAIPGKTGDLLAIIEKGEVEQLEGAAAGLIQKMYTKEWKIGGKDILVIRKMLDSDNPNVRRDGIKLLAHLDDYRIVPLLINSMYDEDSDVQLAALEGLCKIARKFNGFGWYAEPTNEKWKEEIAKWKQWYRSVRPEGQYEDEIKLLGEEPGK